ncbi:MAG: alpha/beta hydrolase family protein [Isosphaerales bacterium]
MKSRAEQTTPNDAISAFIRRQATGGAGGGVRPPATLRGWDERLARVRVGLSRAFGRAPEPCPLEPEVLGTLKRDGYAIERLTFQSRPGVRVTANLYRPEPVRGRCPGVLSVHGHWAWARIDPHVQPRCIGLARLGYVVLCVDAFGSGERAIEPGPGTYHGALVGASLWPVGTPLIGLQVHDNRRAVDYLISRGEVDPGRLAITGASGGGNQSLYAGATDERLAAVIPVCGIGTYDAYLATACCVCEVNAGGAAYATTGDLLAMVAPRALLVISATRDALQFSVGEAAKSVAAARERFRLMGQEAKIRQVAIDSGHDYNQPMREAMYGWVEKWLHDRGDGSPVPEPRITVEDVAALRCYPDGPSRPKTIVTIPEFARREGQARLAALPRPPDHRERWNAEAERMRTMLRNQILGGFPKKTPLEVESHLLPDGDVTIATERGVRSAGRVGAGPADRQGTAILAVPGPKTSNQRVPEEAQLPRINQQWREARFATLTLADSRLTLPDAANVGPIAGVADHTVAEWGLWVNRPLLGQWVWDIIRWLDFLDESRVDETKKAAFFWRPARPYVLIGIGAMSLPALLAAALDPRVAGVSCVGCLVSFVGQGEKPWSGVPMGLIAPNILDVGDVGRLAALVAPRPLVITSAIEPEGGLASPDRILREFAFTRSVYELMGASDRLKLSPLGDLRAMLPKT